MPKQIYKIEQFHGGLNSNADPRDVEDNELTESTDIIVDNLGKIRTLGGTVVHDAPTKDVDVYPGYGLFTFSHDRQLGHLSEHLDNTGDFSSNWDRAGDMAVDSTDATYTHSSAAGTLIQTAADRNHFGIGSVEYIFTYTISGFAETITLFEILGGSGQFANATTALEQSNGTHNVVFASRSDCASNPFTINVTSGTSGAFNIDNVSLVPYDTSEDGDDYLVLSDDDSSDSRLYLYSRNLDTYGTSETIFVGTSANFSPVFYSVDGALRISDAKFGVNNPNIWYGYVNGKFFPTVDGGELISQWVQSPQSIRTPATCLFDNTPPTIVDDAVMTRNPGDSATNGGSISREYNADGSGDAAALDAHANVYRVYVTIRVENVDVFQGARLYTYTVTVQDHATSPNVSKSIRYPSSGNATIPVGDTQEQEHVFYFSAAGTPDINIAGSDTLNVDVTSISTTGTTNIILDTVVAIEGTYTAVPHTDVSDHGVWLSFDDNGTGTGWDDSFHSGISFIIDDSQEGAIKDIARSDGSGNDIMSGLNAAKGVDFSCYFKWNRSWDKRVTGFNVYLRKLDASGNILSQWYKQCNINFLTGKLTTASGIILDIKYDVSTGEYIGFIDNSLYTSPFYIETYQTSSGINEKASSIHCKYKTALVANRMAYVGNLEIEYFDGSKEVKGDAIIKSPVNKFDIFPDTRIIEASIRDGDSIIKLEEYADRLLQFKKTKMQLINISQDLEFLEDTFMHKGVSHPSSVCKTDFGIAWANVNGCYLYDGKQVVNLLEKSGRQIISEEEWDKFLRHDKSLTGTRLSPMVGYLPKKRQIIIYDHISNNSTADPRMYLYDMVTGSWTKGAEDPNRKIDVQKTNFINDWNGDLVYAYQGGITLKWDDASEDTDTISFKTKDIDFGQPGQRKKIYKAYISYKGDGRGVTIQYSINGDTNTVAPFYRCAADGSSENANSDTTPLEVNPGTNDWVLAELKPVSAINNIYSFQLVFGGAAVADFEINDISIIYRLKNVR